MNSAPALVTERLGLHHFAYLRALAEGVPVPEAAARYLHIDHARAARSAHRMVIERARALARRRSDPAWRLVGIEIRLPSTHAAEAQAGAAVAALPSLDEWAADQGFEGFRQCELLELYTEAFGLAASGPAAAAAGAVSAPNGYASGGVAAGGAACCMPTGPPRPRA